MCCAKERTDVGAELGTDDLVGAVFGAVRSFAAILHCLEAVQYRCGSWPKLSKEPNLGKIRPCLAEI